jgi:hypothetical protein
VPAAAELDTLLLECVQSRVSHSALLLAGVSSAGEVPTQRGPRICAAEDDDEFFEALEEPLASETAATEPPPPPPPTTLPTSAQNLRTVSAARIAPPATPPRPVLVPGAAAAKATFHIALPHPNSVNAGQPARAHTERPVAGSGSAPRARGMAPSSQRAASAGDNPFLPSRYVPPPEPVNHKLLGVHETVEVGRPCTAAGLGRGAPD